MWRVLLVEDEAFVRRKLKETMDWEGMGFVIAGEAGNGMEALELIRRLRPDAVITDIQMPLMNGVELLKQARMEGFDSRFVMLTVMSDFHYVQQALEFGATSYMLKLYLDPETLKETMGKVDKELAQRSRLAEREADAFYRKLWSEVAAGGVEDRSVGRKPDGNASGLEAGSEARNDGGTSRGVQAPPIPGLAHARVLITAVMHGRAAFSLQEFLALGLVEAKGTAVWHTFTTEGVTTFFCWTPEAVEAAVQRKREVPYVLVYSDATASHGLKEAWRRVSARLDVLWYRPFPGVHPCEASAPPMEPVPLPDTWGLEHEILRTLEQLKKEAASEAVRELWRLFETHRAPRHLVLEAANRIERLCARVSRIPPVDRDQAELLSAHHAGLQEALLARLEAHAAFLNSVKVAKTDHPEVNKVIAYLHDHYEEEITLTELAKLACMDDKYLSSVFKKKTGCSIIFYLHRLRIEQAKKLLKETQWSVGEIGGRVGFANDNYFIKIFKRFTGLTPAGYRQQTC